MSQNITINPPEYKHADSRFKDYFYEITCNTSVNNATVDLTLDLGVGEDENELPEIFYRTASGVKTNADPNFYAIITPGSSKPINGYKLDLVQTTSSKRIYQTGISLSDFSDGNNEIFVMYSDTSRSQSNAILNLFISPPANELFVKSGTTLTLVSPLPAEINNSLGEVALQKPVAGITTPITSVRLTRADTGDSDDQKLWKAIKAHFLNFDQYSEFIDDIICAPKAGYRNERDLMKKRTPFVKTDEYNLVKFGTEFFMLFKFGISAFEMKGYVGSSGKLPYYDFIIKRINDQLTLANNTNLTRFLNDCEEREEERVFNPFMVELIWSYWMEQGMLVQALNVITLRFQNVQGSKYRDPLVRFNTDPLRPLSHILWGYIQDEQHRLSIPRRVVEYDHEYGLKLTGQAVPRFVGVDTRVPFLGAFHNLLNICTIYFKESDDTTRIADAFPILNALKEVHLLLAEGNHNAYGNLTWTARQEMLMQQYILARPEMREFLGGRVMVPYQEPWMDRVDTMRDIQGWGTTSIVYFYELAVHGELILLSIRYGNWSDVNLDRQNAANWAQEFRNSIQRYIHAYRAVTGVELNAVTAESVQLVEHFATQPSYLLSRRLLLENRSRNRA
ncbi:hypothetical protein ACX0G7_20045 [Flavitalea antarctica]